MTPQDITVHVVSLPSHLGLAIATLALQGCAVFVSLIAAGIAWKVYNKWSRPTWATYDIDLFGRIEGSLQRLELGAHEFLYNRGNFEKMSGDLIAFSGYVIEAKIAKWQRIEKVAQPLKISVLAFWSELRRKKLEQEEHRRQENNDNISAVELSSPNRLIYGKTVDDWLSDIRKSRKSVEDAMCGYLPERYVQD
jgi:hypothetical protein